MMRKAVLFLILVIVLVSLSWFKVLMAAELPSVHATTFPKMHTTQHTDAAPLSAAPLLPNRLGTR